MKAHDWDKIAKDFIKDDNLWKPTYSLPMEDEEGTVTFAKVTSVRMGAKKKKAQPVFIIAEKNYTDDGFVDALEHLFDKHLLPLGVVGDRPKVIRAKNEVHEIPDDEGDKIIGWIYPHVFVAMKPKIRDMLLECLGKSLKKDFGGRLGGGDSGGLGGPGV